MKVRLLKGKTHEFITDFVPEEKHECGAVDEKHLGEILLRHIEPGSLAVVEVKGDLIEIEVYLNADVEDVGELPDDYWGPMENINQKEEG